MTSTRAKPQAIPLASKPARPMPHVEFQDAQRTPISGAHADDVIRRAFRSARDLSENVLVPATDLLLNFFSMLRFYEASSVLVSSRWANNPPRGRT